MSVLPPANSTCRKRCGRWLLLTSVVGLLVVASTVWWKFFHAVPQQFASPIEQFKYGSIGVEENEGLPYWIWLVLPRVFPEYLPGPGGYTSLGIVWEEGREMPVGFSKRHIGYDRVAVNCALCHTATYRTIANRHADGTIERTSQTVIVPTGPAVRVDPQAYLNFLRRCAENPRFNADTLLAAIEYNVELSWLDRQIYRRLLIPGTRKAILQQADGNRWMADRPRWGHGRIDPFNPVKFGMLKMDPALDDTVGNSDMMPLWELSQRRSPDGFNLHWDGLNSSPYDTALAGALGDGASRKSLPLDRIRDLTEWLDTVKHPQYPLPHDEKLAVLGREVFRKHCHDCHGPDGTRTNRVIPYADSESATTIATDLHRLRMWNPSPLRDPPAPFERYNAFADGYRWDFNSFRPTKGYVSVPLTGLWLRAPYLHNGSVPTLDDLLNPPLTEEQTAELLNLAQPGLYDRLSRLLGTARPPGIPESSLAAELDRLKPLVDITLKLARAKGRRPPFFYRGSDVLDPARVGFVHTSDATTGRRFAVPFATFIRGNGNGGHLFGTELPVTEKLMLVEYLKTL